VRGDDLGGGARAGLVLRRDDDVAGARGELAEALHALGPFGLGGEPLLRGLLAHPHAAADVGPGRAAAAGLVDEVPDEGVGHLADVVGEQHGVGQLLQGVVVRALDGGDEVVEPDGGGERGGVGHGSTVG
jgi:hypothetical protein